MPQRRILLIASEAVPFAKTGGLGDVAGALPLALARLGQQVLLVLPRYRGVSADNVIHRMPISVGGRTLEAAFLEQTLAGAAAVGAEAGAGQAEAGAATPEASSQAGSQGAARAVLVDCPELFDRPSLYGVGNDDYHDNAVRFAFLARAALEFCARHGFAPDLLHAHDWQAGLAPVYLRTLYAGHPVLGTCASVFTIHNLAYQGLFPPAWVPALDLGWELFGVEGLEFWGKISFLKGGINFSEMVTTVSRRYAREIQTPAFGSGFDGILRRRSRQVCGILNGIDVSVWNPETDPFLPRPFGPATLGDKQASRQALLEAFSIPVNARTLKRPIVGMISRLVDQKGFDLLSDVAGELTGRDATFVLLGSGEERYQDLWRDLATRHADRLGVRIGFDEALAHLIEAGSDIFLMPSRFEPCGLNQMYSLRYGTVPVVHATGGLDDTIDNWNPRTGAGTGFKFAEYSPQALLRCLDRALALFGKRRVWKMLQLQGMKQDHSWDVSAAEYVKVYEKAIRLRREGLRGSPV